MLWVGSFGGLDAADREVLSNWHRTIADRRIDMIVDMSLRAWNTAGARVIIGVFEQGKDIASWLVVEYHGSWILVHCADHTASAEFATLAEVLTLIVV